MPGRKNNLLPSHDGQRKGDMSDEKNGDMNNRLTLQVVETGEIRLHLCLILFISHFKIRWMISFFSNQVTMCQEIHEDVSKNSILYLEEMSRHNYVTPTSFLELLGIYSDQVSKKKQELKLASSRLRTGLDKVISLI